VKTRGRNNLVEYFSAAARIPLLNSVNVRCFFWRSHLDIPNAGAASCNKSGRSRYSFSRAGAAHRCLFKLWSLFAAATPLLISQRGFLEDIISFQRLDVEALRIGLPSSYPACVRFQQVEDCPRIL
jgi:hypothetical protein